METTIYLIPRGKASPLACWQDPNPHAVKVEKETAEAWFGKPTENPACPTLQYPKFAWERLEFVLVDGVTVLV